MYVNTGYLNHAETDLEKPTDPPAHKQQRDIQGHLPSFHVNAQAQRAG